MLRESSRAHQSLFASLFIVPMSALFALQATARADGWSAVQAFNFRKSHYQVVVPVRNVQSLSVDVGFYGNTQERQEPGRQALVFGGHGKADASKLRVVASGLTDRADVDVVLGQGRNEMKSPDNRTVYGDWRAGFQATVDVKKASVLVRLSPKVQVQGKRYRWTTKEISTRARRTKTAVNKGWQATKTLPGLQSELSRHQREAANNVNGAGGRATIVGQQVRAALKAKSSYHPACEMLAAILGAGEFGENILRRQGAIGVRVQINGELVKLDENWQPIETAEEASANVEASASRDYRTWKSADGKTTIRAKLIRRDGDIVRIRKADGKEYASPLARFSAEDIKWVMANAPLSK